MHASSGQSNRREHAGISHVALTPVAGLASDYRAIRATRHCTPTLRQPLLAFSSPSPTFDLVKTRLIIKIARYRVFTSGKFLPADEISYRSPLPH